VKYQQPSANQMSVVMKPDHTNANSSMHYRSHRSQTKTPDDDDTNELE
jgi:hypothetical protein